MQEKIREIAARVRELRELSDVSIAAMASHLNIPESKYSAYESGEDDIPASILYEIAQWLKVDMAVLLTGESPRMHVFSVTRKGHGVSVERRKQYKYQNLAANFCGKKVEPFIVTVEPRAESGEITKHSHPGQEFNFILEGSIKYYIHNNEVVLEAGDSIYFDSGYDHAMEAAGNMPARFLAVIL